MKEVVVNQNECYYCVKNSSYVKYNSKLLRSFLLDNNFNINTNFMLSPNLVRDIKNWL